MLPAAARIDELEDMTIDATVVKMIAGGLAGLSLVFGVLAAYLWYRSATAGLDARQIRELLEGDESHARLAAWLAEGASFNKWAAFWTAVSVLAGALSTALDHMA